MLCSELGIANAAANEQHAAYVGSWIKALKEDPNEIFRAAKDADAICEFLYEREKEYLKTREANASLAKSSVEDIEDRKIDNDGEKVAENSVPKPKRKLILNNLKPVSISNEHSR